MKNLLMKKLIIIMKRIEKFEQGDFEQVTEITLEDLEKRITLLEQEIRHNL